APSFIHPLPSFFWNYQLRTLDLFAFLKLFVESLLDLFAARKHTLDPNELTFTVGDDEE
ncbi:unnamed protein product, partial [Amoebophrya sp. A25]